ncbi:MAG: PrsW family intramembrane metalloprotease [Leptospiraceae bacterium]|nr:PrsW family intramembrane metalloprotease [Leptospiraceae bacterium]
MHWIKVIDYALKIFFSIVPVVLVFWYYFRSFVFKRSRLITLSAFFWGILSSGLTILLQSLYPATPDKFREAFLYAALTEELIRYGFVFLLVKTANTQFTVTEGIFHAILVGLGFSFAENLHYSLYYNGFTILVRTISSVAIHVFLSGIMGYFISYASLNNIQHVSRTLRLRNALMLGYGLLLPVLVHGVFDWVLITHSPAVYTIPVIVILSFVYLEQLLDLGRQIFGRNILKMLAINADDVSIMLQQQEYERWVSQRQRNRERLHWINSEWPAATWFALALMLSGLALAVLMETNPRFFGAFKELSASERITLLVLYPLTGGLITLIGSKVNFSFIRIIFTNVPQTALVNMHPPDDEDEQFSFVMNIHPIGVFVSCQEHWPRESKLILDFVDTLVAADQKQHRVATTIVWSNLFNKSMPLGYICHFERQSFDFIRFRLRYQWHKLLKVPLTIRKLSES